MNRTRFLKCTEAADRLGIEQSTFYKNHRAMGLFPVDWGTNGKPILRWPEDEVERFVQRKLDERDASRDHINRVVRFERQRRRA